MGFITFIVIGVFVGWLAGILVKGSGFGGFGDLIVGVIGSILGGSIFELLGARVYGFWPSIMTSVVGAVVFLSIISLFKSTSRKGGAVL